MKNTFWFDYEYLDRKGEKHYSSQLIDAPSKEEAVQLLKNCAKAFGYEVTAVTCNNSKEGE